ncbi:DASH complex subunit ask1 [Aspergillus lentulus]|uniref:DASH complex subunit ASK1 n=1 Tax=Aspergillus lentulus TaxID=293939 RepID=A0AAN5YEH9_ASPLE|nr:DASH complex subunit ask1 [Aspergillus lentulus]KAF4199787.1 hypothetical protein CNMCM8927_004779 [Aspergillus lentulus]GFF26627.1 DASH complex subunit ask1 [Aspergillus lentulus]GFF67072.1 DASH complex subunit ask1 [Aspergillus lentulus]GFF80019.1 DASH complex subunit ask1 [Aspergillus lentulus]GFG06596.1 DASH complex subunit ask1 [Aspergillus lentulus]
MSRPSSISQRPLTLTEELEKLEQSITLTLQEIDHNFSQAHRIVTTSILPLVEQYAEHSRDVWEGAKFWKQFFEASANVSLSGYEERPDEDTTQDQTVTEDSTDVTHSNLTDTVSYETPSSERHDHRADDLELTSLGVSSHSTPRVATNERPDEDTTITSAVSYTSPYETLKQEIRETDPPFDMDDSNLPSTPGRSPRLRDYAGNPADTLMSSSPFVPPASHEQPSGARRNPHQKTSDPVMHRVLDKTYRVQATPLGKGYSTATSRSKFTVTPKVSTSKYAFDDSPISSPEPEAPQLHAEIFSSPLKATTPGTGRKRRPSAGHLRITPKPGMSVLTPAKNGGGKRSAWDSDEEFDDEEDENFGPSPPKTMQFHIPQSRLMKTPAKEASKRIVEDLLFTAGVNDTTDDIIDEQSPSVIRRVERLEDETF